MKTYQKPTVTTIEIPERTSYACNLHFKGCPHLSSLNGGIACPGNSNMKQK